MLPVPFVSVSGVSTVGLIEKKFIFYINFLIWVPVGLNKFILADKLINSVATGRPTYK